MDLLIAPYSVPLDKADRLPQEGIPQYATGGNPAQAIPATLLTAGHYNSLMAEIYNAIVAGGVKPDRNDWGQLARVLSSVIGRFSNIRQIGQDDQGIYAIPEDNGNKVYLVTRAELDAVIQRVQAVENGVKDIHERQLPLKADLHGNEAVDFNTAGLTVNGVATVMDRNLNLTSNNMTPNQDGYIVGNGVRFNIEGVNGSLYIQKQPGVQTQLIIAVQGGDNPAYYAFSDNGVLDCLKVRSGMVQTDVLTTYGGDLALLKKLVSHGNDLVLNCEGKNWNDVGHLDSPAVFFTASPLNDQLFAYIFMTDILNQETVMRVNIKNKVTFTFHENGDLDVNGDYFAKRREVDTERTDRINADNNLQNNINTSYNDLNGRKADNAALDTERQDRINADVGLKTNIDNNYNDLNGRKADRSELNTERNERINGDTGLKTNIDNNYNDLNGRKADRSQLPFPENMHVQLFSVQFAKGIPIWNNQGDDYRLQTVTLPTAFSGGFHNVFCSTTGKTPPALSIQIVNNSQFTVGMHQSNYDYLVNDLTINFMAVGYY